MTRPSPGAGERILVIKLGALGDFVQAFAAMQTIRAAHPDAEITLLTTPPYADLARASGLFQVVETDGRPRGLFAHLRLFARLRARRYRRVYDLQTSSRSRAYFHAFRPRPPEWSGISPGASHRQTRPDRDALQNLDRLADQLHVAGIGPAWPIGEAPGPDLSWAAKAAADFVEAAGLSPPYVLLIPGASPGRPEKRWPAERFADLAARLEARGLTPAIVGGPAEAEAAAVIRAAAPRSVDLVGRTSFVELAALGAGAALTVGNDTGPAHVAAFAGAPSLVLFSRDSDPALCAPRTPMVRTLRRERLADLDVKTVLQACEALLAET